MKKFSTAPVVALGAALAAGSAGTNADAASLDSVFSLLAGATGQVNVPADFTFALNGVDTLVLVNGVALDPAGVLAVNDVITTTFTFDSISSTGPIGAATVELDASENSQTGATSFQSTVAVFGTAEFLITSIVDGPGVPSIEVTGNPADEPLFQILEDNDPSFEVDVAALPAGTEFATVGNNTASTPFTLLPLGAFTFANFTGLDILSSLPIDSLITSFSAGLVDPSSVLISSTGATGELTVSAVVVPSPAAAGVGVLGVLGLLGARRRRPTQVA